MNQKTEQYFFLDFKLMTLFKFETDVLKLVQSEKYQKGQNKKYCC